VQLAVTNSFRNDWGRVVASLIRVTGDWDLAEECAQDAFTLALERWQRDGIPRIPGAWLTTVARNRAIDRLRRHAIGEAKLREVALMSQGDEDPAALGDDRLRLMFTCCHPALNRESQVALTLRTLAGMTTPEIARAFVVSESTMAQRIVRAKKKIHNAGIPFKVPPDHQLVDRTSSVLAVLYLLFNEGYAATSGAELTRQSLCAEAIFLARTLCQLMPDEPEALGLLSLMLLHDARRSTRVDSEGDLVLLEHQDRSHWDGDEIAEGSRMLDAALHQGRPGPFQIQAAIAACHAHASSAADTDWHEIAGLYGQLLRVVPSPVVELNRAVAVAMSEGPEAGLALVDQLSSTGALPTYHLLPATRADLLRRLGRNDEASISYRSAIDLVTTEAELRYLQRRLTEVTTGMQA
jgi:RNA polymerase sigma-70 factor, ECF subfamily